MILSLKECEDFVENLLLIMYDYSLRNIYEFQNENYDECFLKNIDDYVNEMVGMIHGIVNDEILNEYREKFEPLVNYAIDVFYEICLPPRSHKGTFVNDNDKSSLKELIEFLRSVPQPEQRTEEWYKLRNNLITASNAYKIFGSDASKNQLIYEKCLAYNQKLSIIHEEPEFKNINTETTLHWGQKFEHVSIMIYEYLYNTKIEEFGCIKHPRYDFIGASPDGINIDESSKRYGRLLEIKNIVNREINGIPKTEYWVQMQLQMEVCNLDECDFLETRFKEYENEQSFLEDGDFTHSFEKLDKGIIMYFSQKNGTPKYVYKPLTMEKEEFNIWETQIMECYKDLTWIRNIYWKMEEFSCVLVLRNKLWFDCVIYDIREFWKIIAHERENGFEHRKAKKRAKVVEETQCLIRI
jgi:putative phage-type endonuclease